MDMIAADTRYDDLRYDDLRYDEMQYGVAPAPAALLLGDESPQTRRFARLIEEAGARLVAECPLADAADRLEQGSALAAVVVDVARDDREALDAALTAIDAGVAALRFAAIVITTAAAIDVVVAAIREPGIAILIDPDDREIEAALAHAMRPVAAMLADSAGEASCRRLVELGEEVGEIARRLMATSGGSGVVEGGAPSASVGDEAAGLSDLAVVRAMLRLRRLRTRFLEPSLFADPAWDMLLDLMAAYLEGRRVAVSSLCIAAAVPPTTALRWITAMTEQGLFARQPDPADGRRIFIALSPAARTAMTAYVAAARNAFAAE